MSQKLAARGELPAREADGGQKLQNVLQLRDENLTRVRSLEEQEGQCRQAVDRVKKENFEVRKEMERNQQREVVDVPQIK